MPDTTSPTYTFTVMLDLHTGATPARPFALAWAIEKAIRAAIDNGPAPLDSRFGQVTVIPALNEESES
jgi:hypothetical protein